ncbi:hypothetical protein LLG96_12885 [bacterium]|nr:hypothetical protein [bacterium]
MNRRKLLGFMFAGTGFILANAVMIFAATEADRKIEVEQWDKQHLRYGQGVVTDTAKEFLKIPDGYPGVINFKVAKAVPEIDFTPIRHQIPYFFPEDNKGLWSQWGEVTKGPNGCFYMATGDHRCKDGHVFITEYNPSLKEQRIVVDVGKVCGWKKGQYVDGKIHGRMDILPDGTLVAATWLGRNVTADDLDHGFVNGGHLLTYNIYTGMAKYHGIPFLGDSWPYYSVDKQTGVLMAIGNDKNFMAYNVITDRLLYGGKPPAGMIWNSRSMLLDEKTGFVYSTDTKIDHNFKPDKDTYPFLRFDQFTNTFTRLSCTVPVNPETGLCSNIRTYSARRTPEQFFWCFDYQGTLFKFYPDEEKTELVGVNWDKAGVYATSMAMSPRCRYIYYIPSESGRAHKWGTPVIQYDTRDDVKKVIAFLAPFYHEKYGYVAGGTFGIELSGDGSLLVIEMNGTFGPWTDKTSYGQVSIFAVHIPESERIE